MRICIFSLWHARERRSAVYMHIFCVRLLRCLFYCNGHYQSLYKRNRQQYGSHAFFVYNKQPPSGARRLYDHLNEKISTSSGRNPSHASGSGPVRNPAGRLDLHTLHSRWGESVCGSNRSVPVRKNRCYHG